MPRGKHHKVHKSPTETKPIKPTVTNQTDQSPESAGTDSSHATQSPSGLASWNGVKPKCVQERWFVVQIVKSDGQERKLQVTETFLDDVLKPQTHRLSLPCDFDSRVLGQPVCIGCHDDLLILQYNTTTSKFSRFLLLDLARGTVQMFEDSMHYFKRDFFTISPIECLILPGLTWVLFRLPEPLMSENKWSNLLCAKLLRADDRTTAITDLHIHDSMRLDRRNQALAFHPHYIDCVTVLLVDVHKCRICINVYNLTTKEYLIETIQSSAALHTDWKPETIRNLKRCNADFSRGGELLVLCCAFFYGLDNHNCISILIFDSRNFVLVRNASPPQSWGPFGYFNPGGNTLVFSSCGTKLEVWDLTKLRDGRCPRQVKFPIELPLVRPRSLQDACRVVILECCSSSSLAQLGIPHKMLEYLRFKT